MAKAISMCIGASQSLTVSVVLPWLAKKLFPGMHVLGKEEGHHLSSFLACRTLTVGRKQRATWLFLQKLRAHDVQPIVCDMPHVSSI